MGLRDFFREDCLAEKMIKRLTRRLAERCLSKMLLFATQLQKWTMACSQKDIYASEVINGARQFSEKFKGSYAKDLKEKSS